MRKCRLFHKRQYDLLNCCKTNIQNLRFAIYKNDMSSHGSDYQERYYQGMIDSLFYIIDILESELKINEKR